MSEKYGCPKVRGFIRCVREEDHEGDCDFDPKRVAMDQREGPSLKERDILTREAELFLRLLSLRMGWPDERKRDFVPLLSERLVRLSDGLLVVCKGCNGLGEVKSPVADKGFKVCMRCAGLGVTSKTE